MNSTKEHTPLFVPFVTKRLRRRAREQVFLDTPSDEGDEAVEPGGAPAGSGTGTQSAPQTPFAPEPLVADDPVVTTPPPPPARSASAPSGNPAVPASPSKGAARWSALRRRVFAAGLGGDEEVPGLLDSLRSRVFSTSTMEECEAWITALSQETDSPYL
jgi:hypothetical protein